MVSECIVNAVLIFHDVSRRAYLRYMTNDVISQFDTNIQMLLLLY